MAARKEQDAMRDEQCLGLVMELHKKVDEHHLIYMNQLLEIKDLVHKEVTDMKLAQESCNRNWGFLGKLAGLGVGSISLASIVNWLFHKG